MVGLARRNERKSQQARPGIYIAKCAAILYFYCLLLNMTIFKSSSCFFSIVVLVTMLLSSVYIFWLVTAKLSFKRNMDMGEYDLWVFGQNKRTRTTMVAIWVIVPRWNTQIKCKRGRSRESSVTSHRQRKGKSYRPILLILFPAILKPRWKVEKTYDGQRDTSIGTSIDDTNHRSPP
jgi:hypothetical protein